MLLHYWAADPDPEEKGGGGGGARPDQVIREVGLERLCLSALRASSWSKNKRLDPPERQKFIFYILPNYTSETFVFLGRHRPSSKEELHPLRFLWAARQWRLNLFYDRWATE